MIRALFVLLPLFAAVIASAAPLPPPRPRDIGPAPPIPPARPAAGPAEAPSAQPAPPPVSAPAPASASAGASSTSPEDAGTCGELLASGAVIASVVPPVAGTAGCGIAAPVSLRAIVLPDKREVRFTPEAVMRCDFAAALARWVREDIAPTLAKEKLVLEAVANAEGYSCRGRNRVAGAKISEHGRGNAIDVEAFVVAPARRIVLTDPKEAALIALVRAAACARFSTVLGPGSDGYHETHIHLDLAQRKHANAMCQWRLPLDIVP